MILTKSVSRFARNALEILITILSSLAQEESRSISENTRWGVVRRFEKGQVIVNHNKFMGYTKNEKGELVIIPEEAEIVRLVFRLYLEGYSAGKIGSDQKEESKEQIFIKLCADRNPAVQKMRTGISQSHMGEKRQKENRLEMLEPPDRRSKEMRRFRNIGRGYIKQVGYGSHPTHHKE